MVQGIAIIAVLTGKSDTDASSTDNLVGYFISNIMLDTRFNFASRFSIKSPAYASLANLVFDKEFSTAISFVIVLPVYLNCSIS